MHLYWKLQSINNTELLEVDSEEFNIYREKFKKNFETRELMSEEETLIHYTYNSWRNPLFSKIYSLTLAFVDKEEVRVKYITGNEKDLLQTFLNNLKSDYFKEYQLVHSDAEYILPYLGTRLDMHGFRTSLPKDLQYKGLRPWNLTGLSVRDFYQGAGAYKHSLKEIAWVFGLKTNYIEPVEEFDFFRKKDLTTLRDSAINEIHTLVNVHRLMVGENSVEALSWVEEKVEAVEEVKRSILVDLFESKHFNQDVKDYIVSLKINTEEDKENTIKIILANYQTKKDKVADKKLKEKEVREFVNSVTTNISNLEV